MRQLKCYHVAESVVMAVCVATAPYKARCVTGCANHAGTGKNSKWCIVIQCT